MPLPSWILKMPQQFTWQNKSRTIGLGDGYNMVLRAMAMIRETNQYMEITIKS